MSRAGRLLDLVQALRRRREPVTAQVLAVELEVSVRTVYRDVATLMAQGAPIEGEAGIGYVLRPGFLLPPLMLKDEEVEAVVLGLRFVVQRGDAALARAAADAAAKITAVLPDDLKGLAGATPLLAGPAPAASAEPIDLGVLRAAIRAGRKLDLSYADGAGRTTSRRVWPMALAFFDSARVLVAWCELRQGFRHFRCDRIGAVTALEERVPERRPVLMKRWRERESIPEQA